jgi:hypothetical protein
MMDHVINCLADDLKLCGLHVNVVTVSQLPILAEAGIVRILQALDAGR